MPPTMGGPTEAGQGGPCSLLIQVFYRQKWRDFGPATPEARKTLAPNRPAFPPRRPPDGDAIGSNPQPTRDRQEPARPRTPRATPPYLNFPSNIRT